MPATATLDEQRVRLEELHERYRADYRAYYEAYADYLVSIEQEQVLDRIGARLSQMRARLQRCGSTP